MSSADDAAFAADFTAAMEAASNRLVSERRSAVAGVGADVAARLALAPVWTTDVLAASALAPPDALDRLVEAGVATRSGDRYVIAEDRARALLADVLASGDVVAHLHAVAEAVDRARNSVAIPAALERFAALTAGAPSAGVVAARLHERVSAAADLPEAVNWIDAAGRLELGLGRSIVGARLHAGRLVARRRRDDDIARFLDGYFERPALQSRLRALLRGGEQPALWALHVHGVGGTGKTVLVRWLEGQFPSDGTAGSVVRIDFDYLHPNYPDTEPGLLVQVLAAELRLFGESEALVRFERLDALVTDWHERIDEAERTRPDEVPSVRRERHALVHDTFADAVGHLPRPVVLILDTTEELEKAPGGSANVTATMKTLTRLHEAVPGLRVVLSGRRTLPLPPGAEVLPVAGFTRDEAARFVAWTGIDGDRGAAVVDRVAADASPQGLSPFDLSLLAQWARDDPTLDAAAIRAIDHDRYVEHRILARLGDADLEAVLPVVVALGRFDDATLGAVTDRDGSALDELTAAVGRQEWITTEPGGIRAVDVHLQGRLAAYLERHRRAAWDAARSRAAAHLRAHCQQAPRSAVTVEHVAGAIRLTDPADPGKLSDWWARIEERARTEAAFGWLLGITARLLGGGGGVASAHPLFAAVAASHAACLGREEPDPVHGHRGLWQEVHAAAEPGSRLAARAAAHLPGEVHAALERWAPALDEALGAAFVAGLEAMPEQAPATAESLFAAARERSLSPELLAMAALLAGRSHAVAGDGAAARRWIRRAIGLVDTAVGGQGGHQWTDWAVEDAAARIRLWAAATWWPLLGSPGEAARLLVVERRVTNVDQDRAASLAAMLFLAAGRRYAHVSVPEVAGPFPPRALVHLDVPPLFVPRALTEAREGHVDDALALLAPWTDLPAGGADYLAAERTRMLLVRRFRLRDVGEGLTTGLVDSQAAVDLALLADLDALDGEKVAVPLWRRTSADPDPHVAHGCWRAVRADDPDALREADGWAVPEQVGPGSSAAELHRVLDDVERRRLAGDPRPAPDVLAWAAAHPLEPEHALRLLLRAVALAGTDATATDRPARRLGRNLAAEMALDEGELLALRLPDRAGALLDLAAGWFASAGDVAGQLRARAAAALAAQSAAGDVPGAGGAEVAALRTVYRRTVRSFPVPDWDELLARPSEAIADAARGWQPWVARCALAAHVAAGTADQLAAVIATQFATTGDDGRYLLAPELAVVRWHTAAPPQPPPPPTAQPFVSAPVVLRVDGGSARSTTWALRRDVARVQRLGSPDYAEFEANAVAEPGDPLAADPPLAPLLRDVDPQIAVEFHHTADVGAVSWEALLREATASDWASRPVWRRVQRAQRRQPRTDHAWPVLIACSDLSLPGAWHGHDEVQIVTTSLSPNVRVQPRVVHLIGLGVEKRSGVGLEFGAVIARTKVAPARPSAAEMAKWFPDTDLVVVQGLPNDEPVHGTWSREQAAYLRQLGTDFALAGVPAVVVVPALPVAAATAAIETLVTALPLDQERLAPPGLVAAVTAIRRLALGTSLPARAVEDALSVCLFLSDTW